MAETRSTTTAGTPCVSLNTSWYCQPVLSHSCVRAVNHSASSALCRMLRAVHGACSAKLVRYNSAASHQSPLKAPRRKGKATPGCGCGVAGSGGDTVTASATASLDGV